MIYTVPGGIDRLKIYLTYGTACIYLGICSAAKAYWKKKYRKQPLLITTALIREFESQPDPVQGDSHDRIDVDFWVDEIDTWVPDEGWKHDQVYCDAPTPGQRARKLKTILLARFNPEEFERRFPNNVRDNL